MQVNDNRKALLRFKEQLELKVIGQSEAVELAMISLLAEGHILLEGPPGVGKTSLARGLAELFHGLFHRVQMTSDLLPSDIVGTLRLRPGAQDFEFRQGPIFANVLLADELNRTSARTQAALLEAMSERSVSVDGTTYNLPKPFFVVATQNPQEFLGVYPLSESQLDRFIMLILLDVPEEAAELELYRKRSNSASRDFSVEGSLKQEELISLQEEVKKVFIEDSLIQYAQKIVKEIRAQEEVTHGASVRAVLQWIDAVKARAFLRERAFVLPEDLTYLAPAVLAHRICLRSEVSSIERKEIVREAMDRVDTPK